MLILTEDEKNFIRENLENGAELVERGVLDDILLPLDAWLTANGFNDDYSLNDVGRKVQRMYDNIYFSN